MAQAYTEAAPTYEGKYIPPSADSSPEWYVYNTSNVRICAICGAPSNGFHFNAPSCSACAAFFRRTVTLDRKFTCSQQNNCRVNYAMRVICRACRYVKCINHGMDRKAVQPRRDCNIGRRKITYALHKQLQQSPPPPIVCTPIECTATANMRMDMSEDAGSVHYASSYASSTGNGGSDYSDLAMSPPLAQTFPSMSFPYSDLLEDLMREERRFNERRRILFASSHTIHSMLVNSVPDDVPFTEKDLHELNFYSCSKDSRSMILLVNEWLQATPGFAQFSLSDKKAFLCRALLYQCILDPAYITVKMGLPTRFVMFNGMYVGIDENSTEGWTDEAGFITGELKKSLYRPLLERVMKQIVRPLVDLQLSFTEFVALKALVSWKSTCVANFSPAAKEFMQGQLDSLFTSLHHHYRNIGYDAERIAERIGAVVLMMSCVVDVGLEILESHRKIHFFDLWELDSMLLQLLTRH